MSLAEDAITANPENSARNLWKRLRNCQKEAMDLRMKWLESIAASKPSWKMMTLPQSSCDY